MRVFQRFADSLSRLTGTPAQDVLNGIIARVERSALPASQQAIAKAEAKRARQSARLAKQLNGRLNQLI